MASDVVVPLVGTWIEINVSGYTSHAGNVVPLVGTWIEIDCICVYCNKSGVVPLLGTGIEIYANGNLFVPSSRAPRGHVD